MGMEVTLPQQGYATLRRWPRYKIDVPVRMITRDQRRLPLCKIAVENWVTGELAAMGVAQPFREVLGIVGQQPVGFAGHGSQELDISADFMTGMDL